MTKLNPFKPSEKYGRGAWDKGYEAGNDDARNFKNVLLQGKVADQKHVIKRLDTNRLELKAEVANLTRCNDQQVKIIDEYEAATEDVENLKNLLDVRYGEGHLDGRTRGYDQAVIDIVVHLQSGESSVMFLTADQFVKLQGAHGVLDGVLGDIESPPR